MSAEYSVTEYEKQFMNLLISEQFLAKQIKANPDEPLWDQHYRRVTNMIEANNE